MQNIVFNMAGMHRHGSAFYDYLRLRKEFFVDKLGWDIPHDDEVEMDQYDNPTAWYSLVLHNDTVVGGIRVMPTMAEWGDHTYMLRDVARGRLHSIPTEIVVDSAVATPRVWECTRVVVSDDLTTQAERAMCLSLLSDGAIEVAGRHGASELMCLSRTTLVRALRQLGYPAERKGQAYTEPTDGRQYTMITMPVRPHQQPTAPRPTAGAPMGMPLGIPASTHAAPPAMHAPQVL